MTEGCDIRWERCVPAPLSARVRGFLVRILHGGGPHADCPKIDASLPVRRSGPRDCLRRRGGRTVALAASQPGVLSAEKPLRSRGQHPHRDQSCAVGSGARDDLIRAGGNCWGRAPRSAATPASVAVFSRLWLASGPRRVAGQRVGGTSVAVRPVRSGLTFFSRGSVRADVAAVSGNEWSDSGRRPGSRRREQGRDWLSYRGGRGQAVNSVCHRPLLV